MTSSGVPETGARLDMDRLMGLLDMAAEGSAPAGMWMLMSADTSRALAAQYGAEARIPADISVTYAGIPVLLDDEMPHGAWRVIDRHGKTVRRSTPVVPTPPESAPASSAQGDEGGAGSPTSAPPATPH